MNMRPPSHVGGPAQNFTLNSAAGCQNRIISLFCNVMPHTLLRFILPSPYVELKLAVILWATDFEDFDEKGGFGGGGANRSKKI